MKYLMKSKFFAESKKYINLYEELNINEPKIGDYVIVENNKLKSNNIINNFVKANIGQIISIFDSINQKYEVFYKDDVDSILIDKKVIVGKKFVIFWSKDIEDFTPENIEFFKNVKNFNL